MKTKIILLIFSLILLSCGSKKSVQQSHRKMQVDSAVVDNSKIERKIDFEKQFLTTNTNERIITLFGVKFDTVFVNTERKINPISYPLFKSENRDISTQNYIYKLQLKDSIQKAVELKYKSKIDEKSKSIIELKESKMVYQIATLILSIVCFCVLVLYLLRRFKVV